jgi:hypothetical protein
MGCVACGDGSGSKADDAKTVTSEFLASGAQASTPGSGGFIEARMPSRRGDRDRVDELGEAVPEIRQTPGGESVFVGVLRDSYLKAKAECARVPRRKLARRAGVHSNHRVVIAGAYAAARYGLRLWQAAFEGCAVGIASR